MLQGRAIPLLGLFKTSDDAAISVNASHALPPSDDDDASRTLPEHANDAPHGLPLLTNDDELSKAKWPRTTTLHVPDAIPSVDGHGLSNARNVYAVHAANLSGHGFPKPNTRAESKHLLVESQILDTKFTE